MVDNHDVGSPTRAYIAWLEPGQAKNDVYEYVKDFAGKNFISVNASYYAMMPFLGGWLVEIQENGPGLSYLPAIAKALAERRDPAWFRVVDRAFAVTMRDGAPYCVLKPGAESRLLIESNIGHLEAKGKMQRVVSTGAGILVVGATIASTGGFFLISSMIFYLLATQIFVPEIRTLDVESLPHRAWKEVNSISPQVYVDTLKFQNNRWEKTVKQLPKRVDKTQVQGGDDTSASISVKPSENAGQPESVPGDQPKSGPTPAQNPQSVPKPLAPAVNQPTPSQVQPSEPSAPSPGQNKQSIIQPRAIAPGSANTPPNPAGSPSNMITQTPASEPSPLPAPTPLVPLSPLPAPVPLAPQGEKK